MIEPTISVALALDYLFRHTSQQRVYREEIFEYKKRLNDVFLNEDSDIRIKFIDEDVFNVINSIGVSLILKKQAHGDYFIEKDIDLGADFDTKIKTLYLNNVPTEIKPYLNKIDW